MTINKTATGALSSSGRGNRALSECSSRIRKCASPAQEQENTKVVENLRQLYIMVSGEGREEEIRKKITETLDEKSFVCHTEGEPFFQKKTFDDIVTECVLLSKLKDFEFQICYFKLAEASDLIKCNHMVRFSSANHVYCLQGMLFIKDSLVVKADVSFDMHEKIPGEVWASLYKVTSTITERDFGRHLRTAPSAIRGKLMSSDKEMMPTGDRYDLIRLQLTYSKGNIIRRSFRNDHVINITDSAGRPYAHGALFKITKRRLSRRFSMVLFDRKTNPVAFCERRGEIFTIYGTQSLSKEHSKFLEPRLVNVMGCPKQNVIVAFYPWLRVKGERFSANGGACGVILALSESTELGGQADFEPIYSICPEVYGRKWLGLVKDYENKENCVGVIRSDRDNFGKDVEVDIAPGVDLVMMLCITACFGELKNRHCYRALDPAATE